MKEHSVNAATNYIPHLHSLYSYPVRFISEGDYQKTIIRNDQSTLSLIEMVSMSVNDELFPDF